MKKLKLSRSKIELFMDCPKCFYLDVVKNIKRPSGFPFTLNNAIDTLLKKEFDEHRKNGTQHPIQTAFGIDAKPANHPQIAQWQNSLKGGVSYYDDKHDCTFFGGIDDLWVAPDGTYHVVDYKVTAKQTIVTSLPDWADAYKRQVEIYQWLLRKNGLKVSDTAYFVYCTGNSSRAYFHNTLHFHSHLISYTGNDNWIEGVIEQMFETMAGSYAQVASNSRCEHCSFINLMRALKN